MGIGLIGGSLAGALKHSGRVRNVSAWDIDREACKMAEAKGLVDRTESSREALVSNSDLLILSVPLGQIVEEGRRIHALASEKLKAILDVGSAKAALSRELGALWGPKYMGFHPMTGKEKGGVANATPTLFEGVSCILVPTDQTDEEVLVLGEQLASLLGAEAIRLDPEEHDAIAACTSHVPILLSIALSLVAAERRMGHPLLPKMIGGGFYDVTRLASGPSWLVSDLWKENRTPMLEVLDRVIERLIEMRGVSPERLKALMEEGKASREALLSEASGRWRP